MSAQRDCWFPVSTQQEGTLAPDGHLKGTCWAPWHPMDTQRELWNLMDTQQVTLHPVGVQSVLWHLMGDQKPVLDPMDAKWAPERNPSTQ